MACFQAPGGALPITPSRSTRHLLVVTYARVADNRSPHLSALRSDYTYFKRCFPHYYVISPKEIFEMTING